MIKYGREPFMQLALLSSEKSQSIISSNPNVTLRTIEKYPDYPWDYDYLSENPNMTFQYILNSISLHLDASKRHEMCDKWNWEKISKADYLDLQEVINHPELPWNYNSMSEHKQLTIPFVRYFLNKIPWNWVKVTTNMNIPIRDIINDYQSRYPLHWASKALLTRSDIMSVIRLPEFPRIRIDMMEVLKAGDATIPEVVGYAENHINRKSIIHAISAESNRPEWLDYLMENPSHFGNCLWQNRLVTFEFARKFLAKYPGREILFDWERLSKVTNVRDILDDFELNHTRWEWYAICSNRTLTIELLEQLKKTKLFSDAISNRSFLWFWDGLVNNPALDPIELYESFDTTIFGQPSSFNISIHNITNPRISTKFIGLKHQVGSTTMKYTFSASNWYNCCPHYKKIMHHRILEEFMAKLNIIYMRKYKMYFDQVIHELRLT